MAQYIYNPGSITSPNSYIYGNTNSNRYKNSIGASSFETSSSPITTTLISEKTPVTTILANSDENKQQIEFKSIELMDWPQCDLNHDSERVHFVATYYNKKGKNY